MLRKAFTLIELLVVIAIIAILAAILFPVFAQAKLAAKKTAGLSQAKQIGLATQMYLADNDDVYFSYRFNGPAGQNINPAYQKLIQTEGLAVANQLIGSRARNVIFFNQLLEPYTKSENIWVAPTQEKAWVNVDRDGSYTEPQFRSYGGQNSYAINNIAFYLGGMNATSMVEPANTIIMIDASYYNALPKMTGIPKGYTAAGGTLPLCQLTSSSGPSYGQYWKQLGNSFLFRWAGGAGAPPNDDQALKDINARYNGVLNIIRGDTSAKAIPSTRAINDLSQGTKSMWDPWKQGVEPCP